MGGKPALEHYKDGLFDGASSTIWQRGKPAEVTWASGMGPGCMQSPHDNLTRTVLPSLTFVMLLSVILRMQIRGLLDSKMAISDDLVTLSNFITYQPFHI